MTTEKRVSATKEEIEYHEKVTFGKVYVNADDCLIKQLTYRMLISKEQALLLQARAQHNGYNRVAGMLKVIDQIFETLMRTLKDSRIEAKTCKPSRKDESLIPAIEDPLLAGKDLYSDKTQFACFGNCEICEHYHDVDKSSVF
jgi:hypothetical protein